MRYLSVCSGIEAASVAWKGLGWEAVGFSEIEPFPCAVLQQRFPKVKNYGDMTKYKEWKIHGAVDVLVGGTPCQSFSVAGLRQGLADPRGNLMLTFGAMASHFKARWIVWENVPGVLSSNGGRDFGSFLGMLAEFGYGFAYRVLDAQFFGVPQRRRRVFVVGHLGSWEYPAKVLFDAESLSGNPPPRRTKRQEASAYAEGSFGTYREGEVGTLRASGGGSETLISTDCKAGKAVCFTQNQRDEVRLMGGDGEVAGSVCAMQATKQQNLIAYENHPQDGRVKESGDVSPTITSRAGTGGNNLPIIASTVVRRLTPRECERLQGFPDDWTKIPWRGKDKEDCPDSHRYKACGNSMAVPVMKWIGERIQKMEDEINGYLFVVEGKQKKA